MLSENKTPSVKVAVANMYNRRWVPFNGGDMHIVSKMPSAGGVAGPRPTACKGIGGISA